MPPTDEKPTADQFAQAIDDVCVVTAAHANGDSLDSPDVVPCLRRLELHREGRKLAGYPTRSTEVCAEQPRKAVKKS